ncbi:MAG: phosphatidate cytidylyltransferase [Hyphomicrobiales bacterium]|nr:phosphatidate cytidylyltransferase [Hyphomicrobiales bacterium]
MRDDSHSHLTRFAEHELASRVVSALGLALLALGATVLGGIAFALFWAAAAVFFFAEFLKMIGYQPLTTGAAVGAIGLTGAAIGVERSAPLAAAAALLIAAIVIAARAEKRSSGVIGASGLAYAACVVLPVVILRSLPVHGLGVTLWLYALVWTTDIGAFFIGRGLGGPKLWPRISPKKTWSGFVGGTFAGVAIAMLVNATASVVPLSSPAVLALSFAASLSVHAGDFFESALKRNYGVKDSSKLIPGHGGFMDRLDGFAVASVTIIGALKLSGHLG